MSDKYKWEQCTVEEWEKKNELTLMEGDMSEAIRYADLANCREMHDNGVNPEKIQERFNYD